MRFCETAKKLKRTVRCGAVKSHRTAPHRKKKIHPVKRPDNITTEFLAISAYCLRHSITELMTASAYCSLGFLLAGDVYE